MSQTSKKVFIALRPQINTHSEITQGILDYAHLHGPWQTRIMGIDDEFSAGNLRTDELDGAIIEDQPSFAVLLKKLQNLPIITCLNENFTEPHSARRIVHIHCDNVHVGRLAAKYLLSLNPPCLAFVNAPGNPPWSVSREETFACCARKAGMECRVWRSKSRVRSRSFPAAFAKWLEALPVHTAVLAANDPVARHILNFCLELKIAVPERISLLGVDNNLLLAETSTPTLSSISLSTREVGFEAARILERMMNGFVPSPDFELLYSAHRVVERDSTALVTAAGNSFVNRFSDFISARLAAGLGHSLTIDEAVDSAGLSRRSAEVIIKRETGRTLHDEMMRLKLKFALELISKAPDKLDLIADKCGFANASHLCRLFKSCYGKSPASYRRPPTCSPVR